MQFEPPTVHLADILDRPQWLNALEARRNRLKCAPFLMELWAEMVEPSLPLYVVEELTDSGRLFHLFILVWVLQLLTLYLQSIDLRSAIACGLAQLNAIVNNNPTLACEWTVAQERSRIQLSINLQLDLYTSDWASRLALSSVSQHLERCLQAILIRVSQSHFLCFVDFPSGKSHCEWWLFTGGYSSSSWFAAISSLRF